MGLQLPPVWSDGQQWKDYVLITLAIAQNGVWWKKYSTVILFWWDTSAPKQIIVTIFSYFERLCWFSLRSLFPCWLTHFCPIDLTQCLLLEGLGFSQVPLIRKWGAGPQLETRNVFLSAKPLTQFNKATVSAASRSPDCTHWGIWTETFVCVGGQFCVYL